MCSPQRIRKSPYFNVSVEMKARIQTFFSPHTQISGSVETRPAAAVTNGTGNLKSFCHTIQHTVTQATGKFCPHLTASSSYIEILL